MLTFEPVRGSRERMLPLLLLADESARAVRSYIDDGEMFAIRWNGTDVGVLQILFEDDVAEIKNLAVVEGYRSMGFGRQAVAFAAREASSRGADRLMVGTADSSVDALAFYERTGFTRSGVRPGFFDTYPQEIWENGIRARDMIMFEMRL